MAREENTKRRRNRRTGSRWSNFTSASAGCGETPFFCSRLVQLLLQLQALRFPRIPTLGPPNLSSQVLPSGDWLPLAGGLGAGATAGQSSARVGSDGGGSPAATEGA